MSNQPVVLEVKNLKKHFPIKGGVFKTTQGYVKAVDGISFSIKENETFSIVGESGCGKSTAGRTILRLLEPTEGEVWFNGENLYDIKKRAFRKKRKDFQLIFQDPYSSLNPRMTVQELLVEPLLTHDLCSKKEAIEKAKEMVDRVGLSEKHLSRFPHEFSGGQRQPKLVILDEAVSALDVSVQSQILNLLIDLQEEFELTYIFISHDLNVVKHLSDRVGVMYLGQMMELAKTDDLYKEPLHPYTKALLSAIPNLSTTEKKERIILQGDVPDPSNPPSGCPFRLRCPAAHDRCVTENPVFQEVKNDHWVACHLYDEK